MTKKAIGVRGSWFASVDGEALPCVHKHWMKGTEYDDPGYVDRPEFEALIKALREHGKAILTTDEVLDAGQQFQAYRIRRSIRSERRKS